MSRPVCVALLVLALTGCAQCDAPQGNELGEQIPWLWRQNEVTISGRVVSPDGDPTAGATVELVYPGDPHWPARVAFATSTGDDGRFVFDGVCDNCFALVVRNDDGARTYWGALRPTGELTVVHAPMRPVPVRVHCAVRTAPASSERGDAPSVSIRWLPDRGEIAILNPLAVEEDAEPSSDNLSPVLPGWSENVPEVDADARHFGLMVPLPEGELQAVTSGACGTASRVVHSPGEAIELRLPHEDYSRIRVVLSPPGSESARPWISYEGRSLNLDSRLQADLLAPGTYTVHGDTATSPSHWAHEPKS